MNGVQTMRPYLVYEFIMVISFIYQKKVEKKFTNILILLVIFFLKCIVDVGHALSKSMSRSDPQR